MAGHVTTGGPCRGRDTLLKPIPFHLVRSPFFSFFLFNFSFFPLLRESRAYEGPLALPASFFPYFHHYHHYYSINKRWNSKEFRMTIRHLGFSLQFQTLNVKCPKSYRNFLPLKIVTLKNSERIRIKLKSFLCIAYGWQGLFFRVVDLFGRSVYRILPRRLRINWRSINM